MKDPSGLPTGKNSLASLSDDELAIAVCDGSNAALSIVISRYRGIVHRVARQFLSDNGEAEEVVQQVFVEVFNNIKTFDATKGTFKSWLLKRATLRALDRFRQLQSQGIYEWTPISEEQSEIQDSTEVLGMTRPETVRLVEQLITGLPLKQQSLVRMRFFRGMSLKEIQEEMDEPMSVILRLLYDAIRQMRSAVFLRETS